MASETVKSTAKDFVDKASKNAEDAKGSLDASVADATGRASAQVHSLADQASDAASDLYGRAKSKMRDAADGMPDSTADAVASGQRAYDQGTAQLSRQIAKQPMEALILAAAIGYLVGWATSRS